MTREQKERIDNASYAVLLNQWRYADIDSDIFQGECGVYYRKIMLKRKHELSADNQVAVSKVVGWG